MDGSQPPRFDPLWADKKQKASAAPPQAANGVPPMPANGVPPMLLGESSGRLQLPPEMVRPGEAPPMVIQMDPKAYGAAVAGHVATLVLFTVSWCAPCKLFQPSFEAAVPAVQAVNMDVVMGTVDCEAYPQFRAWEQLKQFPTVRFYRQGVSEPQQYDGEWTEAGVVRWVQAQFGVAPPAPPPPPAISAAARAAYLRAMQTMVERVRPAPKPASLVPTTDAMTLSGAAPDERAPGGSLGWRTPPAASGQTALLSADVTSSLAPLVGRAAAQSFWERVRRATAAPTQPSAAERASFARTLAAEATRAETLRRQGGSADGLGLEGDGDAHDERVDETFTDWIGDEEMPEGIDDALTD